MAKFERLKSDTPVHDAFGLTYASFFVVPRVILEAMPVEWQEGFVDLIDEMNDTFEWEPDIQMDVQFRKNGKFVGVPEYVRNYRRPDTR